MIKTNCSKCGNLLGENVKFCGICGTPVPKKVVCPACGLELSPEVLFCMNCGIKLCPNLNEPAAQHSANQINSSNSYTGRLLRKMNGVTKFIGEPKVGAANMVGVLSIYDDRVEFVRKAGLSITDTINALKKAEVETYYYSDCVSVTNGTYLMAYVTLVLNLKNGQKISFSPAVPVSKDMEMMAAMMRTYIKEGRKV